MTSRSSFRIQLDDSRLDNAKGMPRRAGAFFPLYERTYCSLAEGYFHLSPCNVHCLRISMLQGMQVDCSATVEAVFSIATK
jgi:hypothetical protein